VFGTCIDCQYPNIMSAVVFPVQLWFGNLLLLSLCHCGFQGPFAYLLLIFLNTKLELYFKGFRLAAAKDEIVFSVAISPPWPV
jgi:hypothetical protein